MYAHAVYIPYVCAFVCVRRVVDNVNCAALGACKTFNIIFYIDENVAHIPIRNAYSLGDVCVCVCHWRCWPIAWSVGRTVAGCVWCVASLSFRSISHTHIALITVIVVGIN